MPKYLQHPNLYPFMTELRLIGGISFPPTWRLCWLFCRKPTCICRMRSRLPFTQRSPVSGLIKVDVGNVWSRHRAITVRSMALVWWIGVMAGSMVEWRLDGQLLCSVNKCVQRWLAPNAAGASLS